MIPGVTAFGYRIPITVILVFVALVIGLALTVLFWLTVVWSIYRSVRQTREQRVHDELQERLLEGIYQPETAWQSWVDGLSETERSVVETLLDEYLRELHEENAEQLRDLGDALGIPERSRRKLTHRHEHERLAALTWLTLLDRPDILSGVDFSPQTPRERAAVARLWHETEAVEQPEEALSVLLTDLRSQFPVFGQDTLYRIALNNPEAFFEIAGANDETWSEPLLVQVLTVCQHLTSVTTEDLSWVIATLEHENEAVREAGTLALENLGWRRDVRDQNVLERLLEDPSPRVRAAVYETLARWGDEQALTVLTAGLQSESNQRACLAGTGALVAHRDQFPGEMTPGLATAWRWCSEHAAYDSVARGRTRGVSS